MNRFEIDMRLIAYNQYIDACRTSKYVGAEVKKDTEKDIMTFINISTGKTLHPVEEYPVTVVVLYYEGDARRDTDNIQSSNKFILDSLVKRGILKGDSRRYVKQVYSQIVDNRINRKSKVQVFIHQGELLLPKSFMEEE